MAERDKRLWLLDCHDTLNGALRRVISCENGAINLDYMGFEDGTLDGDDEKEYLLSLQLAETAINNAFNCLESICKRWKVSPNMRCPR